MNEAEKIFGNPRQAAVHSPPKWWLEAQMAAARLSAWATPWLGRRGATAALAAGLALTLLAFWQNAHFGKAGLMAEMRALQSDLAAERDRVAALTNMLAEARAALSDNAPGAAWGAQIASFGDADTARRAWAALRRQPDFANLEARIVSYDVASGQVFRLVAGPFENAELARAFCASRKNPASLCVPAPFKGEPPG